MEEAIADHDFAKARACSDEEGQEREKLHSLYQQHGLLDWIYDYAFHSSENPKSWFTSCQIITKNLRHIVLCLVDANRKLIHY